MKKTSITLTSKDVQSAELYIKEHIPGMFYSRWKDVIKIVVPAAAAGDVKRVLGGCEFIEVLN